MRARHRHLLMALVSAIAIAVAIPAGAPSSVADGVCPASTTWDNALKRCV